MIRRPRTTTDDGDAMTRTLIVHEESYKRGNLVSLIHADRLRVIQHLFRKYAPSREMTWGDFGCSSGFILDRTVRTNAFHFARLVGHDRVDELLELARAKNIPNAEFKRFDLNNVREAEERFDFVTCFETLEHVGDYKSAFMNLVNHLGDKGTLIVTVPIETGLVGLAKFLGRMAVRRNPYGDFFAGQSRWKYAACLLRNGYIDGFRKPNQPGYGPHLGFDYRRLEEYFRATFVKSGLLEMLEQSRTGWGMNMVYVLKRG
jgi:hypothetical protein